MSRTDHARKPRVRVRGHVTTVKHVHLYNGLTYFQSACSCGLVGPLAVYWHVANDDGRDHRRAVVDDSDRPSAASAESVLSTSRKDQR